MTADSPACRTRRPRSRSTSRIRCTTTWATAGAPFGSDEGSDLLWSWRDRRDELGSASTLATVLACEPSSVASYAGPMAGVDGLETATFVTSAAFVLLRLTGHLNDDDRQLALDALDFHIGLGEANGAGTEDRVLLTQRDDLLSSRDPA